MPPVRGRKRKSDESTVSQHEEHTTAMAQTIPTKTGSPKLQESPMKRRKTTITLPQKQALIDNLQLEITERARKLRANYNIHAQSLRTRIEIRVNRIPLSLRKVKMGDLLAKYQQQQQPQQQKSAPTLARRGPLVPEKDASSVRSVPSYKSNTAMPPPPRPGKRPSSELSGGDKENELDRSSESPKKRPRPAGVPATDISRNPAQVLSPTSSNSRVVPRGAATPGRSNIARPVSPTKSAAVATNLLNKMVEKARAPPAATRKATATSTATAPPATAATTARTRTKRGATVTGAAPPRPPTRTATRRVSGTSESSDGSTSTVVRKRPATALGGPITKTTSAPTAAPAASSGRRTVMGTIKKGVAGTAKKAVGAARGTAAPTAASTASTGRVLRKRG